MTAAVSAAQLSLSDHCQVIRAEVAKPADVLPFGRRQYSITTYQANSAEAAPETGGRVTLRSLTLKRQL